MDLLEAAAPAETEMTTDSCRTRATVQSTNVRRLCNGMDSRRRCRCCCWWWRCCILEWWEEAGESCRCWQVVDAFAVMICYRTQIGKLSGKQRNSKYLIDRAVKTCALLLLLSLLHQWRKFKLVGSWSIHCDWRWQCKQITVAVSWTSTCSVVGTVSYRCAVRRQEISGLTTK